MDFLDSSLHASILSSLAANLASSSEQDDLALLTSQFSSLAPVTNGAINGVLARLVDDGVEAVVLGCTELELLLTAADCAVPLLPTARLHVQAAVTAALAP